jgi:hypothetical protein
VDELRAERTGAFEQGFESVVSQRSPFSLGASAVGNGETLLTCSVVDQAALYGC